MKMITKLRISMHSYFREAGYFEKPAKMQCFGMHLGK